MFLMSTSNPCSGPRAPDVTYSSVLQQRGGSRGGTTSTVSTSVDSVDPRKSVAVSVVPPLRLDVRARWGGRFGVFVGGVETRGGWKAWTQIPWAVMGVGNVSGKRGTKFKSKGEGSTSSLWTTHWEPARELLRPSPQKGSPDFSHVGSPFSGRSEISPKAQRRA